MDTPTGTRPKLADHLYKPGTVVFARVKIDAGGHGVLVAYMQLLRAFRAANSEHTLYADHEIDDFVIWRPETPQETEAREAQRAADREVTEQWRAADAARKAEEQDAADRVGAELMGVTVEEWRRQRLAREQAREASA